MTDQTHTRLSDESMAKVIERQMGWDDIRFWQGEVLAYESAEKHADSVSCEDPRTDTATALRLLSWLFVHEYLQEVRPERDGWNVWINPRDDKDYLLPISGEPFRYAVCNLAARVLGVEGASDV